MELLQFIVLSAVNLGLIVFIIRKWSFFSAEGLCMGTLGMMILTDNVELIFHYLVSPEVLPLGYKEFSFRIYPTIVHIIGLAILIAALLLFNPEPKPVARQLNDADILKLRRIGVAITLCGLFLTGVALYLVSGFSTVDFYVALNAFRSETLPFGGFWYRGADIAVLGMALTLPSLRRKMGQFFLVLILMMFVAFFLRTNKGGLEEPIVWGAFVIHVYDRAFFRSLFKIRIVVLACAIAVAGMGVKGWLLPWLTNRAAPPSSTIQNLLQLSTATMATRWGDNSVYRGYCQFVNFLPDNRFLFQGHKVGLYTLTSWVPRVLVPNKEDHPFRGIGFMIYADFHTYPLETPSPTLVGSVMADDGIVSLAEYLFLTVLFLSIFRRAAMARSSSLYWHVGYVIFVLFGGFSAEVGILGLFYILFLVYGVVGVAYLLLFVISQPSLRPVFRLLGSGTAVRVTTR